SHHPQAPWIGMACGIGGSRWKKNARVGSVVDDGLEAVRGHSPFAASLPAPLGLENGSIGNLPVEGEKGAVNFPAGSPDDLDGTVHAMDENLAREPLLQAEHFLQLVMAVEEDDLGGGGIVRVPALGTHV